MKDDCWNIIWSILAPPKVAAFSWKATHGRLGTRLNLYIQGSTNITSFMCPLCEETPETANHLFCHCNFLAILQNWLLENCWKINDEREIDSLDGLVNWTKENGSGHGMGNVI
ncbi:hypothetical protein GQ457_01G024100 [Hibiscus cannabinus]